SAVGVRMVVTLGALLADVPHTRPVRVTGSVGDPGLGARLGLQRSRYEGPTGILGVLQEAFDGRGVPTASLWANVPHYVSQSPSPKATLALVERAAHLLTTRVEVVDLQVASAAYERQVDELVASDDEALAYVARLEEQGDEGDEDDEGAPSRDAELPDGDELAAEVEQFLREHRPD
ncbi:MAG: PAC2 family protein, partial [Acidimicrobiales bacterium]